MIMPLAFPRRVLSTGVRSSFTGLVNGAKDAVETGAESSGVKKKCADETNKSDCEGLATVSGGPHNGESVCRWKDDKCKTNCGFISQTRCETVGNGCEWT